jgi:Protein of unknown function (DUF2726)
LKSLLQSVDELRKLVSQDPFIGEALPDAPWPVAARNLLTERERSFYQWLLGLYPEHKIFVQVALSQLIDVPKDHPGRHSIRNRFSQLVADFVLCRADLSILAVIELDDRSHYWPKRRRADARKNKALADAGIRLVRIPAGALPPEDALRRLVDGVEQIAPTPAVETVLCLSESAIPFSDEIPRRRNDSRLESRALRSSLMKAAFGGALLVGGWIVYNQFLPSAIRTTIESLPVRHSGNSASPRDLASIAQYRIPGASVAPRSSAQELAERRQSEMRAAAAAKKEKASAWAAFYVAPASCEHPVDWTAQVECGNRYMRAKKVFDSRWAVDHSAEPAIGEVVVLDNQAVGRSRR